MDHMFKNKKLTILDNLILMVDFFNSMSTFDAFTDIDCGVFVCMAAYCIYHKLGLNYSTACVNPFRLYIAWVNLNGFDSCDQRHVCFNPSQYIDHLCRQISFTFSDCYKYILRDATSTLPRIRMPSNPCEQMQLMAKRLLFAHFTLKRP